MSIPLSNQYQCQYQCQYHLQANVTQHIESPMIFSRGSLERGVMIIKYIPICNFTCPEHALPPSFLPSFLSYRPCRPLPTSIRLRSVQPSHYRSAYTPPPCTTSIFVLHFRLCSRRSKSKTTFYLDTPTKSHARIFVAPNIQFPALSSYIHGYQGPDT